MRWLLDTNFVIDAFAGRPDALAALHRARTEGAEWIGCSAITRLEALSFAGLSAEDESGLRELLAQFSEVAITHQVIDEAIRIRKVARLKAPDAIIAATAILQNADLVTRNASDFKRVAGLKIIDPASL